MKKIVLSLAGVLAATAFAPEAAAVPVFARQTGMACSACHYQHFPLLNSFGRAFKSSGFTIMGAQGKVEGEHLDIPATLNMSVLATVVHQTESNAGPANAKWQVPAAGGELSIFYGGRMAEFAGFLSELGLAGAAATGAAKVPVLFPMGDSRVGFVAYTGNQGAAYSFELLNTGAADTHKMMGNAGANRQHVAATYAAEYMGVRTNATGLNLVATNPNMGFVNVGRFAIAGPGAPGANTLPLAYVRVAGLFNLGGWDSAVGVQNFNGNQSALGLGNSSYKATIIDSQFQGQVGGMSTGIYVTYARAPADTNGNNFAARWATAAAIAGQATNSLGTNAANVATNAAASFNVAGSLEIIPGISTLQAAIRRAHNGGPTTANGDNAYMLGATYELAQNIELSLNHTAQSGSAWNAVAGVTPRGQKQTTLLMEMLF